MKTLRNILLLFSYIFGIIGIGVILFLQIKFLPLSLLALALVVLAFFLVKTERRHARIPFAIAALGIALAFLVPVLFPAEINEADSELSQQIEEDGSELENLIQEDFGDLDIDEDLNSEEANANENDAEGDLPEPGDYETVEVPDNIPEEVLEDLHSKEDQQGLAAPVIVD